MACPNCSSMGYLHRREAGDKGLGASLSDFWPGRSNHATMLDAPLIYLRVPGQLAYRELATRAVAFACKHARSSGRDDDSTLDEEFAHEAVSAIGEAFNNVVIHGYAGRPPGDVTLQIETFDDKLVVQMIDDGASFDPSSVPDPDLEGLPESGMGLFIIRSFVDTMTYVPGPPNSLQFTKIFR